MWEIGTGMVQIRNWVYWWQAVLQQYIHGIFGNFNRPVTEEKSFPAGVAAISHVEPVAVKGTYHASQRVYMSVCHDAAGMRAFIGKRKYFVVKSSDADIFTIRIGNGDIIGTEIQVAEVVGYFNAVVHW